MVNSRNKGADGEREFAKFLRDHGVEARRGQQYSGGSDSPDVVTNLEGVHFEVKRVERFLLWKAMEQAKKDAANGSIPAVAHRANGKEWVVVLPAADFVDIMLDLSEVYDLTMDEEG